jgi:hypothetical protein
MRGNGGDSDRSSCGSKIAVGVIVAVVTAAVIGSWDTIRTEVCARVELRYCSLALQPEALGRWTFVRFEPDAPSAQSGFGMTIEPKTLSIFDNGKYTSDFVVSFEGGFEGQPDLDQRASGAYVVRRKGDGWAEVEFESTTENKLLGVGRLEFGGRELRLTDVGLDVTYVFRRN